MRQLETINGGEGFFVKWDVKRRKLIYLIGTQ